MIPFIQFVALLCILEYANQAIIKDGSYLSTARLLRPLVDPLGDRGCLLTGEEIAEEIGGSTHDGDGSVMKVVYGWREPVLEKFENAINGRGRLVRHVDVIRQTEGLGKLDKMPGGLYDGLDASHGVCCGLGDGCGGGLYGGCGAVDVIGMDKCARNGKKKNKKKAKQKRS